MFRAKLLLSTNDILPAKAVDKKADREGAKHSSHREDGHRKRPQSCQSALRNGF